MMHNQTDQFPPNPFADSIFRPIQALILGSGPEVVRLATHYANAGDQVLLVADLPEAALAHLDNGRAQVVSALPGGPLMAALATASTVIVAGVDDDESERLAESVARAAGALPFPSVVLFHSPHAARAWRARGVHAVPRSEALIAAALRAVPPWPSDRVAPAPVVIGDVPLAAQLVRGIVIGWQQPGERIPVHCIACDTRSLAASTDELTPRAHLTLDEACTIDHVVGAVTDAIAAWEPALPQHARTTGPTIYVCALTSGAALAARLVESFPDARVCLVSQASTMPDHAQVMEVTRTAHIADPAVLLLTPRQRLSEEILAEIGHWPTDIPSLFGSPDRIDRDAVSLVARHAEELLTNAGLVIDAEFDPDVPRILLGPEELTIVRDRLVELVPAGQDADQREHAQRALEFAARLPALLARSGRHPHRPPGYVDLFADLDTLARNVHAQYQLTARRTRRSAHQVAQQSWGELSPFLQQSNRAQLADVPVKLAAVGLTCRAAVAPRIFEFPADTLEHLAILEHRRWEHFVRRNGHGDHKYAIAWDALPETIRCFDRDAVAALPKRLAAVGIEIIDPNDTFT